jgi:hypothetical protein
MTDRYFITNKRKIAYLKLDCLNLKKYIIMKTTLNLLGIGLSAILFTSCRSYEEAGYGSGNDKYAADYKQYTRTACDVQDTAHICYFVAKVEELRNIFGGDFGANYRLFGARSADGKLSCIVAKETSHGGIDASSRMYKTPPGTTCPFDCWVGTARRVLIPQAELVTEDQARTMIRAYEDGAGGNMRQVKIPGEALRAASAIGGCELIQVFPVNIDGVDKILIIPLKVDGGAAGTLYYVLSADNRCPEDCLVI